ncbi:MAG: Inner membrane transport protein YajR [Syntrophorhabdus sp. PtaU1.Bin153]|nr:MAG: Inner membrane transport protein YajR [Syntrophorhabdus sp. PtaU1.Bin153]
MHDTERMNSGEIRAGIGLTLVFAFRMLGMFMVLPVLATYGMDLADATPALIGLAIGAYGLTQAVLQIPFGMLSDRIGRRPVIYAGLLVFAAGSALAAGADSIWGVIAGRVLQGAGAISAAVMALLSDLTREQHRTKAMAMIGMSIGLSFAVAMVVGPLLTRAFGLSGLFWVTAGMALLGIVLVVALVPKGTGALQHRESSCVVARESSHVEARESSHVVAAMNASVKVQNSNVIIDQITQQAVAICMEQCTIKKRDKTAQVIVCPRVKYDIASFAGIYKSNLLNKSKIILYKSVNPETLCDYCTGKIKYEGTVICPDFDPDPERQCGGGLHLSPTPELALNYHNGKVLKCEVALKDIVVHGSDITKVRCRKIKVLGEIK